MCPFYIFIWGDKMNLHLENSYLVTDIKEMKRIIAEHLADGTLSPLRTARSYLHEWYAHNRLYAYGLFRSHTKDVDLNDDETPFRLWCYELIWSSSRYNTEEKELEKIEDDANTTTTDKISTEEK